MTTAVLQQTDAHQIENKGIAAIIHLQRLVGINEARARAQHEWRCMKEEDRVFTLNLYDLMRTRHA